MNLQNFIYLIFEENPTTQDLITIVSGLAAFWLISFAVAVSIVASIVKDKPWFRKASDNDYERSARATFEKIGVKQTVDEYFLLFQYLWPLLQCVAFQHFAGGMLCVPSLLGFLDESTASSLACLGILSEIGWEISDTLIWLYKRYFTENGKIKVPGALFIILGIHHSLSSLLGIPMILNYRNSKTLHLICFEMQAASAVALFVQEYTKLLDVSVPRQLRLFQIMTGFALAVMFFCRMIHWPPLVFEFCKVWYKEKAWTFMVIGTTLGLVFTIFNWSFCIEPCYARFVKFMNMSVEYEKLPRGSAERRASAIALQAAAIHVLAQQSLEEEVVNLFVKRKVPRRVTAPPSYGRQKRPSLALLRASGGDLSRTLSRMSTAGSF